MFGDIVTVCVTHSQEIIYVYNYANETIFKHRRICKICTANICAHYMHMLSFLIENFDLKFKENKFLITSLYFHETLNSVISL
jgi:hypothetical protein